MNEMRIYVASLSDYNNGRLEGKWLDLADYSDASELMEAIQEMLDGLTKKYKKIDGEVREEWAVHDYEGIPSTLASEYMGEQDFQQLYDIAEVAEDRGVPVEVLVERAGDTGSDDYQALADSLMFVVDGSDESDIVHEYEDQIGELGSDFWSNHIYVDDVTERVLYGEDVDRFRDDILSENPDMDEDEAERQSEEMADEEAERREDLATYLEDMGYGDEIPSWVSKDYEGAWKRSLSYDFDVIHHDGEMYVFSNSYSVGGTILSGMIGAYIGYKVGKEGLNRVAYKTGEKLGKATRKVKRAVKGKKKYDTGGGVKNEIFFAIVRNREDKNYWKLGWSMTDQTFKDKEGNEYDKLYFAGSKYAKKYYLFDFNYLRDIEEFTATSRRENGIKFLLAKEFVNNSIRYYIINLDEKSIHTQTSNIDGIKDEVRRLTEGKNFYGKKGVRFAEGGGIGFKALSAKVAKRYEGKKPEAKYRGEYGKRYSKSEAKEVGDKVAGKVYWQQKGRKMETGGLIDEIKRKYQTAGSDSRGVYTYSKRTADEIAIKYNGDVQEDGSKWYVSIKDEYAKGGGISGLDDLIRG